MVMVRLKRSTLVSLIVCSIYFALLIVYLIHVVLMFSDVLELLTPSRGCFIILILYPMLAFILEPIYMNSLNHFKYPSKKSGDVPNFIFLGWGLLMVLFVTIFHYIDLVISLLQFVVPWIALFVLWMAIVLFIGMAIECIGTRFNIWKYDKNKLEELSKRSLYLKFLFKPIKWLNYTPAIHIFGYPIIAAVSYFIVCVHDHASFSFLPEDIADLIFIWISGLVMWFFGLYRFTEHEISNAVKRLRGIKENENV